MTHRPPEISGGHSDFFDKRIPRRGAYRRRWTRENDRCSRSGQHLLALRRRTTHTRGFIGSHFHHRATEGGRPLDFESAELCGSWRFGRLRRHDVLAYGDSKLQGGPTHRSLRRDHAAAASKSCALNTDLFDADLRPIRVNNVAMGVRCPYTLLDKCVRALPAAWDAPYEEIISMWKDQ